MSRHSTDRCLMRVVILAFLFATPLAPAGGAPPPGTPAGQQSPLPADQSTARQNEPLPGLKDKQKRDLMKANYEKMKRDAEELASLAKSLRDDIDKGNENVLSLHIVDKAEKIEKLAKRIKSVARGY